MAAVSNVYLPTIWQHSPSLSMGQSAAAWHFLQYSGSHLELALNEYRNLSSDWDCYLMVSLLGLWNCKHHLWHCNCGCFSQSLDGSVMFWANAQNAKWGTRGELLEVWSLWMHILAETVRMPMWHSCKVNRIDLIYSTFLTVPVDSNAKAFGSVLILIPFHLGIF